MKKSEIIIPLVLLFVGVSCDKAAPLTRPARQVFLEVEPGTVVDAGESVRLTATPSGFVAARMQLLALRDDGTLGTGDFLGDMSETGGVFIFDLPAPADNGTYRYQAVADVAGDNAGDESTGIFSNVATIDVQIESPQQVADTTLRVEDSDAMEDKSGVTFLLDVSENAAWVVFFELVESGEDREIGEAKLNGAGSVFFPFSAFVALGAGEHQYYAVVYDKAGDVLLETNVVRVVIPEPQITVTLAIDPAGLTEVRDAGAEVSFVVRVLVDGSPAVGRNDEVWLWDNDTGVDLARGALTQTGEVRFSGLHFVAEDNDVHTYHAEVVDGPRSNDVEVRVNIMAVTLHASADLVETAGDEVTFSASIAGNDVASVALYRAADDAKIAETTLVEGGTAVFESFALAANVENNGAHVFYAKAFRGDETPVRSDDVAVAVHVIGVVLSGEDVIFEGETDEQTVSVDVFGCGVDGVSLLHEADDDEVGTKDVEDGGCVWGGSRRYDFTLSAADFDERGYVLVATANKDGAEVARSQHTVAVTVVSPSTTTTTTTTTTTPQITVALAIDPAGLEEVRDAATEVSFVARVLVDGEPATDRRGGTVLLLDTDAEVERSTLDQGGEVRFSGLHFVAEDNDVHTYHAEVVDGPRSNDVEVRVNIMAVTLHASADLVETAGDEVTFSANVAGNGVERVALYRAADDAKIAETTLVEGGTAVFESFALAANVENNGAHVFYAKAFRGDETPVRSDDVAVAVHVIGVVLSGEDVIFEDKTDEQTVSVDVFGCGVDEVSLLNEADDDEVGTKDVEDGGCVWEGSRRYDFTLSAADFDEGEYVLVATASKGVRVFRSERTVKVVSPHSPAPSVQLTVDQRHVHSVDTVVTFTAMVESVSDLQLVRLDSSDGTQETMTLNGNTGTFTTVFTRDGQNIYTAVVVTNAGDGPSSNEVSVDVNLVTVTVAGGGVVRSADDEMTLMATVDGTGSSSVFVNWYRKAQGEDVFVSNGVSANVNTFTGAADNGTYEFYAVAVIADTNEADESVTSNGVEVEVAFVEVRSDVQLVVVGDGESYITSNSSSVELEVKAPGDWQIDSVTLRKEDDSNFTRVVDPVAMSVEIGRAELEGEPAADFYVVVTGAYIGSVRSRDSVHIEVRIVALSLVAGEVVEGKLSEAQAPLSLAWDGVGPTSFSLLCNENTWIASGLSALEVGGTQISPPWDSIANGSYNCVANVQYGNGFEQATNRVSMTVELADIDVSASKTQVYEGEDVTLTATIRRGTWDDVAMFAQIGDSERQDFSCGDLSCSVTMPPDVAETTVVSLYVQVTLSAGTVVEWRVVVVLYEEGGGNTFFDIAVPGGCSLAEAIRFANEEEDGACLLTKRDDEADRHRIVLGDDVIVLGDDVEVSESAGGGDTGLPAVSGTFEITSSGENPYTISVASGKKFRLFHVTSNGDLTLDNVIVSGGEILEKNKDAKGGCIFNDGTLTIINGAMNDCSATSVHGDAYGGGVYSTGSITLRGVVVGGEEDNEMNVAFSGAGTANGGGIAVNGGRIEGGGFSVLNNRAEGGFDAFGGGIWIYEDEDGGSVTALGEDTKVIGNRVSAGVIGNRVVAGSVGKGGGIYVYSVQARFVGLSVESNRVIADIAQGGGMFLKSDDVLYTIISDSSFYDNKNTGRVVEGGGIYFSSGGFIGLYSVGVENNDLYSLDGESRLGANLYVGEYVTVMWEGEVVTQDVFAEGTYMPRPTDGIFAPTPTQ